MNNAEVMTFEFEGYELDLERRLLTRSGRDVTLRPKSFDVLAFLVTNAGSLISKDEIFSAVWPDTIVSDESLSRCISDIRLALGDKTRKIVRTVPGRGYQFAAQVTQTAISRSHPQMRPQKPRKGRRIAVLAMLVCVIVIVAGWVYLEPSSVDPTEAGGGTIAVLPFQNISTDPKEDVFAEGLAEDLIADLSRIEAIKVVSRTTSFSVERPLMAASIAKRLKVRYIVDGSVRREGNQLRITASLIDALNDATVWSNRYDGKAADVFAFQDRITNEVVNSLRVQLTPKQRAAVAVKGTSVPEAYDAYLRGLRLIAPRRRFDGEANAKAQNAFNEAIRIDPDYALAYAGLAWAKWVYFESVNYYGNPSDAFALAEKSLSIADNALAHRVLAKRHFSLLLDGVGDRKIDLAVEQLEAARRLQPGDPDVLADLASALSFAGRPDEAVGLIRLAMERNPDHPDWYFSASGVALLLSGNPQLAARDLALWSESIPNWHTPHLFLAAAYGLSNEPLRAEEELARHAKLIGGRYSLHAVNRTWPMEREQRVLFEKGLKAAGI